MFDTPWGVFLTTFLYSLVGGIIPFLNVEAYLLGVSAMAPGAQIIPVVIASTAGQMAAKSLLYLSGEGLLRLPVRDSARKRIDELQVRLARHRHRATGLLALSAVTGLPPFYSMSVAAGALRMPFWTFFVIGTLGRALRFAVVFVLPRLM
jgi:membrane protein YqaA with SNARE-associated domain